MLKVKTPLCFYIRILTALALAACSGSTAPTPPSSAGTGEQLRPAPPADYAGKRNPFEGSSAAAEKGKEAYNVYCASCHGSTGKGDGPAAASLNPKPSDLAGHANTLADDYMFWRISEGGMMEPFKSVMPAWKDSLDEEKLWQLIAYIHTLGGQ